jgi:hypothetical protein
VDAKKIADTINLVKDGVERSTFGPMFVYPNPNDFTKRDVNQLSMIVFNSILPVMIAEELAKERPNVAGSDKKI